MHKLLSLGFVLASFSASAAPLAYTPSPSWVIQNPQIKTDQISPNNNTTIQLTAPLIDPSTTFANLPTSGVVGQKVYCKDCYSSLSSSSATPGLLVQWNGSNWVDGAGYLIQNTPSAGSLLRSTATNVANGVVTYDAYKNITTTGAINSAVSSQNVTNTNTIQPLTSNGSINVTAPVTVPSMTVSGGLSTGTVSGSSGNFSGQLSAGSLSDTTTVDGASLASTTSLAKSALSKTLLGAPNGVAGLDNTGHLANTGLPVCLPADRNVLIGGNNSVSQLATPSNIANLMSMGRTALYASAFAINNMEVAGDALTSSGSVALGKSIMATFANTGPGIGEEFYDNYGTPDIASSAHNDGGGLNSVNGPAQAAAIGWAPTIMMMNITRTGNTADNQPQDAMTQADISNFNLATTDIEKNYPSVKYVYPYINGQTPDWTTGANHSHWALSEQMIQAAGGVGIDLPVGLSFASFVSPTYLQSTVNEIAWANANNVVTILLLTPWSASPPSGVLGQFADDSQFLVNTKRLIEYLKNNNALPSAYVVSNYSGYQTINGVQVTSNLIGQDTNSNDPSVAYVARWVAENAPTSPYVPLPVGSEQSGAVPCPNTVNNGMPGSHTSIGAGGLGLGSMAFEDTNNFHLFSGTFYGSPIFQSDMELFPGKSLTLGFGGTTPNYIHGDGNGNGSLDGSWTVGTKLNVGTGGISASGDIGTTTNFDVLPGKSVAFGATGTTPSFVYADGNGNGSMSGNWTVASNFTANGGITTPTTNTDTINPKTANGTVNFPTSISVANNINTPAGIFGGTIVAGANGNFVVAKTGGGFAGTIGANASTGVMNISDNAGLNFTGPATFNTAVSSPNGFSGIGSNLTVQSVDPSTVQRSLQSIKLDTLNLKDYGAVCDGVTDDSGAIQKAFTAVSTQSQYSNGVAIQMPFGSCYSSIGISVTTSDGRTIALVGAGKTASKLVFGSGGLSISIANGGEFFASRVNIRRNASTQSGTGLSVTAPAGGGRLSLDHVQVDGATRAGSWTTGIAAANVSVVASDLFIQLPDDINATESPASADLSITGTNNTTNQANNLWSIDNKIVDSVFQGGFYGVYVAGAVQGMFITNSEALGGSNGFYWDGSAPNDYAELLLLSNFHSNSFQCGVCTNAVNQISIDSGLFLHFDANSTPYYSIHLQNGQNAVVSNTMTNGSGASGNPETVIQLDHFGVANIHGNQGETINGPVVEVNSGSYTTVTGNVGANFPNYSGPKFVGCGGGVECVGNNSDGTPDMTFDSSGNLSFNNKGNTTLNGSALFLPQTFASSTSGYGFNIGGNLYNALTSSGSGSVTVCPSSTCILGSAQNNVQIPGSATVTGNVTANGGFTGSNYGVVSGGSYILINSNNTFQGTISLDSANGNQTKISNGAGIEINGPLNASSSVSVPTMKITSVTHNGAVPAHSTDRVTLVGYGAMSSSGVTLTTNQAVEATTNNIMSILTTQWSKILDINAHLVCTDYNGSLWGGNVEGMFTSNGSTPYTLVKSQINGTPIVASNGQYWTPTFSVSSLSGAAGPLFTLKTSGSDTANVGCTADLSIVEDN